MAITYKIENDTSSKWVKLITINSDSDINIFTSNFEVKIIDIFQHFNGEYLNSEDTFQFEEYLKTILSDDSEVPSTFYITGNDEDFRNYVNNDLTSLLSSGIQFWMEGTNCLKIRIVCAGKCNDADDFIGYAYPYFKINFGTNETLEFIVPIIPIIEMGIPEKQYPDKEDQQLPNDISRTSYDWEHNTVGTDVNLYVNNSTATSSNYRETPEYTPKYIVKSSAYRNDYLVTGETTDIFTGETIQRNFDFVSAFISSKLENKMTKTSIDLPYDIDEKDPVDYTYVTDGTNTLSGKLYCTEFIQIIEDSGTIPKIKDNSVVLKFEV